MFHYVPGAHLEGIRVSLKDLPALTGTIKGLQHLPERQAEVTRLQGWPLDGRRDKQEDEGPEND